MTRFEEFEKKFQDGADDGIVIDGGQLQPKRSRRRSRFASTVGFFLFFLFLILVCIVGIVYAYRDRLILEYVRDLGPKGVGVEVLAMDSIVTRPIGQISMEVRGLVFQSSKLAPSLRAERVLISTPKNILNLYQSIFLRETLPLNIQLVGLQVSATSDAPGTGLKKAGADAGNAKNPLASPPQLPFPIDLETEFRDAEVLVGSHQKPFTIKNLTGVARTTIEFKNPHIGDTETLRIVSSGQLAMGLTLGLLPGQQALLPIRTDWALEAEPKITDLANMTLRLTTLSISTLGMNLKSRGSLKWPEQKFDLEVNGSTTDLGRLPLDEAESRALGLSGRLKGSADIDFKVSGKLDGLVSSAGLFRLREAVLPFNLPASVDRKYAIEGPVQIDLEAPFELSYDMSESRLKSIRLQTATLAGDFTSADVRFEKQFRKPAALMMAVKAQVNADGETIDVTNSEFRLANLLLKTTGKVSIGKNRNSVLEITATLPSLTGWPALLPGLTVSGDSSAGVSDPISMAKAQGSVGIKAKLELPLGSPENLKTASSADIEILDIRGIEFPIHYSQTSKEDKPSDRMKVIGVLRGQISGSGKFALTENSKEPIKWNLKQAKGFLDFTDLIVDWKDLITKTNRPVSSLEFAIKAVDAVESVPRPTGSLTNAGSPLRLSVDRFDVRIQDSTYSLSGMIEKAASSNDLNLNTKFTSRSALSQLYDLFPKARSQRAMIPSGTLTTSVAVVGTLKASDNAPLETSPLSLRGTFGFIGPRANILALAPSTTKEPTEKNPKASQTVAAPDFIKWPIVKQSSLTGKVQIAQINLKTTELKSLSSDLKLMNGRASGRMNLGLIFGGVLNVKDFSVGLADMSFQSQGDYKDVDLSLLGEFVDPQWKTSIGGKSSGSFKTVGRNIDGSMNVKNGFFSTASIDQLVNRKLREFPQIEKLIGAKPNMKSGGAHADMTASYSLSDGRLNLKTLTVKTPEKNDARLSGWIQPDLNVELQGDVYLNDPSIGGSFRQANSDSTGRLLIPIKLKGSLSNPSLDIAQETISKMVEKTLRLEAGKAINQKKNEAINLIKDELKKRGLGF